MRLSVVIPTYNRRNILPRCIKALEEQVAASPDYEILIVDDGSTDGTVNQISDYIERIGLNIRLLHQNHSGPAAARNLGIKEASGDLVLFIGDDIIAAPDLLIRHTEWHDMHSNENLALLGYVTWSPEIEITPFMHWLENGGPQFKYWSITNPEDVFWGHLVTANISFKRHFLLENGLFDEDFRYASYEDTELGYRLHRKGFRIVYNRKAVGYHYHPTTIDDAIKRMRNVAISKKIFSDKTNEPGGGKKPPERNWVWRNLSFAKFYLSKQLGYIAECRWTIPVLYSYILDKAQYEID